MNTLEAPAVSPSLEQQISALTARVATLEQQISALLARIVALEAWFTWFKSYLAANPGGIALKGAPPP